MYGQGTVGLKGNLGLKVIPGSHKAPVRWRLRNMARWGFIWGWLTVTAAKAFSKLTGLPVLTSQLSIKVFRVSGEIEDYGVVARRVITNAGVAFLVDAWQNLVELETMKYHGLGESAVGGEQATDTTLESELTTEYNPNNTRATGSTTEGASANIFRTVGTNTLDEAAAIVEHGIFDQAATGGGVLWDRSEFLVINLGAGDGLQSTYDMTATAGG
jgi:hypothetical protein